MRDMGIVTLRHRPNQALLNILSLLRRTLPAFPGLPWQAQGLVDTLIPPQGPQDTVSTFHLLSPGVYPVLPVQSHSQRLNQLATMDATSLTQLHQTMRVIPLTPDYLNTETKSKDCMSGPTSGVGVNQQSYSC